MFNILIASPRKQKHKGHFVEVCCLSEVFHTCLLQSFRWDRQNVLNFKSFLLLSSKVRDLNISTYCTSNSPWSVSSVPSLPITSQIKSPELRKSNFWAIQCSSGMADKTSTDTKSWAAVIHLLYKSGRYTNSHCAVTWILKLCVNRGSESRKDRPLRMSAASLFTRSYISNKHTNTHSDMRSFSNE